MRPKKAALAARDVALLAMLAALLYLGAGLGLLAGRLAGRGLDRRATSLTRSSPPMLPGLMRILSMPWVTHSRASL